MTNEDSKVGSKKASIGTAAKDWWEEWRPKTQSNGRRNGDAGAFARLRRADLHAAMMEEVTFDLFKKLEPVTKKLPHEIVFERAALIAAVLTHVREHESRRVAEAAAGEKMGDQQVLHPLRLRRLFATRSAPDCLIAFRRLVALLDKKVNVADLAESLFDWPDEVRGDKRRTRWAFDYYGASSAAPDATDQAAA